MSITMFRKGSLFRDTALVAVGMVFLAVLYLGVITRLLNPYQDKKLSLDPYLEFSTMNQSDEESVSFEDWVAGKDFEPISKWDAIASRKDKVYWFRFRAEDVHLPDYVPNGLVELNEGRRYWTVKSLSLYLFRGNEFRLLSRSGVDDAIEGDPHSGGFALPFSIEDESESPSVFYIRAVVRENFQPTFRLWKEAAWQQQFQYKQDLIFCLNLGILFCLLVFSGLSALSQRSRMLGVYFGYLLVSTTDLINVWQSQTGNWLFWSETSYLFFLFFSVLLAAVGIRLLTVFTRDYLSIQKGQTGSLLLWIINLLNIFFLVAILVGYCFLNFHVLLNCTALRDIITSALFLYVGFRSLERYRRHATFYMLAFSIMFLLTASFHLIRLCYLPEWPYPLSQLPLQDMGLAWGSFILALAMVDRLKTLQQERDYAQKEALRNIEQLHKVEETARKELSQKVEERTQELGVALKASQQANEAKNVFLANMSHELRTPLNAIIGYAQLLQGSNYSSEKLHHSVKIIEQSGAHLLELINDILNLSKIEADQIEVEESLFNLSDLLVELVEMFRVSTDRKGISLEYCPKALPQTVVSDRRLIRQILINILGNAVKFTESGKVVFAVEISPDSKLCIQVEDTGVGIASKEMDSIFDPFTQAGLDEAKHKGTGLGLSISRKLVRALGGDIEVKSVLGQGSCFCIKLPVSVPSDTRFNTVDETLNTQTVVGYQGDTRSILVVDDEESNRSVMNDILGELNFHVLEADSGQTALHLLKREKVDLVLLDLRMPEMDGFTVAQTIREQDSFKTLPIIASSAGVEEHMHRKALECGCNDFLPKPIDRNALLDLLEKFLHISWIEAVSVENKITNTPETIPVPSDLLQPLLQHAKSGYVVGVKEALDEIEAKCPEATFFIQKAQEMFHSFDLEGIVALAQKHKDS
jgi:signal transduction histidine kinase/DNA-binding NarL/FixJ family response regulator